MDRSPEPDGSPAEPGPWHGRHRSGRSAGGERLGTVGLEAQRKNGMVRSATRHYGAEMKHIYGDRSLERSRGQGWEKKGRHGSGIGGFSSNTLR